MTGKDVNLEITTFFFYLRFPYCPNISDLELYIYIYIYIISRIIYIYIYIYTGLFDLQKKYNIICIILIMNKKNIVLNKKLKISKKGLFNNI